jgi:hypothetical protein
MLKSKRIYSWFIIGFLALTRCVEPTDLKLDTNLNLLVVDGLITNNPGPYTVKLTMTAAYNRTVEGMNAGVKGAKVWISDDAGEQEQLQETEPGVYTTRATGIRGTVGRTYTLDIEIPNGKKYRSQPELLQAMAPIDSIYSEFVDASTGKEEGFYVYLNTNDPGNATNYYRWHYTNYSYRKFCNSPEEPQRQCCTPCWDIFPCKNCFILASDALANGKTITKLLTIVPYSLSIIYYLDVEQYSLSKNAYEFWKQMGAQSRSAGTSFDPAPAPLKGNMFNVNDQKEEVLGFFGASAYQLKGIGVKRDYLLPKLPYSEYKDPPFTPCGCAVSCKPCLENEAQTQKKPGDFKREWMW